VPAESRRWCAKSASSLLDHTIGIMAMLVQAGAQAAQPQWFASPIASLMRHRNLAMIAQLTRRHCETMRAQRDRRIVQAVRYCSHMMACGMGNRLAVVEWKPMVALEGVLV